MWIFCNFGTRPLQLLRDLPVNLILLLVMPHGCKCMRCPTPCGNGSLPNAVFEHLAPKSSLRPTSIFVCLLLQIQHLYFSVNMYFTYTTCTFEFPHVTVRLFV